MWQERELLRGNSAKASTQAANITNNQTVNQKRAINVKKRQIDAIPLISKNKLPIGHPSEDRNWKREKSRKPRW